MDQLGKWFDGSDLIAFCAGVVSTLLGVWGLLSKRGISLKSLDYQRRQTETDEGRRYDELKQVATADIYVTIQRQWRTNSRGEPSFYDYLVLTNKGQAVAQNVQLESFESKPTGDDRIVTDKSEIFPLRELGAGASVTTPLMLYGGMGSYFEAVVSWDDGRGRHRESRIVTIDR